MRIVDIGPGRATLEMTVRDEMLNGFDICHGGFITTLADSAFAFACNSRNEMTVAAGLSVDLVAAARAGDVLSARAAEVHQAGRTGVYDMTVTNQRGELVACARGRSYRLKGRSVVPVDPQAAETSGAQP
jgi:acyl-CoA thioesterase